MNVQLEVWSGGQTGIDRAALDAAMQLGLKHGGYVPKGRLSEDGPVPDKYTGLRECNSVEYPVRTELNIRDTDATLLMTTARKSRGTELTRRLAQRIRKPLLVISVSNPPDPKKFWEWITANRITKLNVAGPRESKNPGIHDQGLKILLAFLKC